MKRQRVTEGLVPLESSFLDKIKDSLLGIQAHGGRGPQEMTEFVYL